MPTAVPTAWRIHLSTGLPLNPMLSSSRLKWEGHMPETC